MIKSSSRIAVGIVCLLLTSSQSIAQSVLYEELFTKETSLAAKFQTYVDSIDKYLYRDVDLVHKAFKECEDIIRQDPQLGDSLVFEHNLNKIYFLHNELASLDAYRYILKTDADIDIEQLSPKQILSFNYIKAFTLMSLGDMEAAQKLYYENIDRGWALKDTNSVVSNMYSLGQLYSDDSDHEASIKVFLEVQELLTLIESRPSTRALVAFELAEAYYKKTDYEDALKVIRSSLDYLDEHELYVLKNDILLIEGNIHLVRNNIDSAELIYKTIQNSLFEFIDAQNRENTNEFLADIYDAKEMYSSSIAVYDKLISEVDTFNHFRRVDLLNKVHLIYDKMGNPQKAYEYVLKHNKLKLLMDQDEKKQKTNFLKIKFDSEQKEIQNLLLSSEIKKEHSRRKYLYALIGLAALGLLVLFGAFYQKNQYNRELKRQVEKRTKRLKISNEKLKETNSQLDEFNRILSHDLKEPLRSIIGFSELVIKDPTNSSKVREYTNYIKSGGVQLSELIQNVSTFREYNNLEVQLEPKVNVQEVFDDIFQILRKRYPNAKINFKHNQFENLHTDKKLLKTAFIKILDNSVKYNISKEVNIELKYFNDDTMHHFEIKDNGIGIESEYHEIIFKMFKRLNSKKEYLGSGMGLSLACLILEKLKGEISLVQSNKGKGSTFLVSLPNPH